MVELAGAAKVGFFDFFNRYRPAQVVALGDIAPLLFEECPLQFRFDTLSHNTDIEHVGKINDGFHNVGIDLFRHDVDHERAINLDHVDGEALEVVE